VDVATIQDAFARLPCHIERHVAYVSVEEALDCEPILVGRRFVVVPAGRIVLPIDAAMAFGSGRHETTQLCLEALERYLVPGQTVFDVGCGSGILALAAEKLGASRVVATDMDEAAVTVAKRHFSGLLFVGSADCLPSGEADLVICNITSKVNDRLAWDLKRLAKPGGLVLISGFMTENPPQKFAAQEILQLGGWECWLCEPSGIQAAPDQKDANQHDPQWWL